MLSHLLLGPKGIAAWTRDAETITDNRPFLEFRAARQLGIDKTQEIVESIAPFLEGDDLSDYLTSTSTQGEADIEEVQAVRRAMVGAWLVPYEERDRRAATLERGLATAPRSNRLRSYYRSYMDSWIEMLKHEGAPAGEIDAVERRVRRELEKPKGVE